MSHRCDRSSRSHPSSAGDTRERGKSKGSEAGDEENYLQRPSVGTLSSAPTPPVNWLDFNYLSACFVAFAHGSNDVGDCSSRRSPHLSHRQPLKWPHHPLWILVLGGAGIVTGLAIWGKKHRDYWKALPLQPSGGFAPNWQPPLILVAPGWAYLSPPLCSRRRRCWVVCPKYQVNSIQNRSGNRLGMANYNTH